MQEFFEMPWYHYAIILYVSLWFIKMITTVRHLWYIADYRVGSGQNETPEGMSTIGFKRLVAITYSIGAGVALTVLLIPTLYKEKLGFFESYSREQVQHFAETGEWKD